VRKMSMSENYKGCVTLSLRHFDIFVRDGRKCYDGITR
jgi:hypothetical protein